MTATILQDRAMDRSEYELSRWHLSPAAQYALGVIAADYAAKGDFDAGPLDEIREEAITEAWCDFDGYESYWDDTVLPRAKSVDDVIDAALAPMELVA